MNFKYLKLFLTKEIIFILILIIVLLITLFVYLFTSPSSKTPPLPVIMTTPQPTLTQIYNQPKTQINTTTDQDVSRLPNIKNITQLPEGKTQYLIQSYLSTHDNKIVTQGGKVIFERTIIVNENLKHPLLSEYKSKYGEPEKIIQGSKSYGRYETYYLYPSKGFTLIANPYTEEIDEIQTFVPMSVEQYLKQWGDDIQPIGQPPYPI